MLYSNTRQVVMILNAPVLDHEKSINGSLEKKKKLSKERLTSKNNVVESFQVA